ncbi:hypothetical protein ACH82I_14535 [Brevibacterium sp. GP-SGM9]|uniref:hypothetical protein n=1 Tax=unclassified Brevibacterium TaxID=2614124 RepID=UPI001E596CFF|nr:MULTISPECIES: hypothetical protein [unclassified Brevibacterium]MCD1285402.1 hypothetical protein [Brevibacterium sp. CCUG 69071]MDK8434452.1 hypothetical protein [Brevibacterium sp. H-BE7]
MGYIFLLILIVLGAVFFIGHRKEKARQREILATELQQVKKTAEEDVTSFGEEVAELDILTAGVELDTGGSQDYKQALDSYDVAKETLEKVDEPADIRHVTEALEDGRYAAKCVRARIEGKPLPVRRPPCFFNPQHGPSVEDIDWAPAGGQLRPVPVCAADAERVAVGAEPAVRKVVTADGHTRRAYWEAGPAYAEYNRGYFNSYAGSGLLPGVLMGAMLFGGMGGGWDGAYGADAASGADGGGDIGGGDGGGDMGGGDGGGLFGGDGFDLGDLF